MKKKFARNVSIYIFLFLAVLLAAFIFRGMENEQANIREVPLSEFVQYLADGKISEINVTDTKLTGTLSKDEIVYAYANSVVEISLIDEMYLFPQMQEGTLKYESDPPDNGSVFLSLLPTIIMVWPWASSSIHDEPGGTARLSSLLSREPRWSRAAKRRSPLPMWPDLTKKNRSLRRSWTSSRIRENTRSSAPGFRRASCWWPAGNG